MEGVLGVDCRGVKILNIVLFGDSHLARFGKDPIEQLEKLLDGAIIYNCSTGGFTSADGARRAAVIGKTTPDVVVFSYGGNDVSPWKIGVPEAEFLQNMKHIFEAFPESHKLLFTSPDVAVADPAQTEAYNTAIHRYRASLKPMCDELQVTVVDGGQIIAPLGEAYHEDDGVHMNQAAYVKVIGALADTIRTVSL
jgi:lysophospholipase L1-like esterase